MTYVGECWTGTGSGGGAAGRGGRSDFTTGAWCAPDRAQRASVAQSSTCMHEPSYGRTQQWHHCALKRSCSPQATFVGCKQAISASKVCWVWQAQACLARMPGHSSLVHRRRPVAQTACYAAPSSACRQPARCTLLGQNTLPSWQHRQGVVSRICRPAGSVLPFQSSSSAFNRTSHPRPMLDPSELMFHRLRWGECRWRACAKAATNGGLWYWLQLRRRCAGFVTMYNTLMSLVRVDCESNDASMMVDEVLL
jgi:hypothetical protein